MHIAIAPIRLKATVTEEMLLAASDEFEARFVKTQDGIVKRILVKDANSGDYADIVFFRDLEAMDRVIEAEQTSDVCAAYFSIMHGDDDYRS